VSTHPTITLHQAVHYELMTSWWAPWISHPWWQERAADYYVWKTRRKHRRYQQMVELCQRKVVGP